jgi:DNA gyrase subunit A
MKKINMVEKGTQDWLNYGISVAKSRAIPYAEDNLKPVQRRILYAMGEAKLWNKGKTVKCAAVVGDVMKYYHPHGDASIYDALIHMSQWWKTRYPLIEVQGNNGSLNGDGPAAHRYTECKLTLAGEYVLKNVDPDIVPYRSNYDDTTTEPELLPSIFPNVLCNGSLGIAVGMSCSLLPHNLNEECDLLTAIINGNVNTVDEALTILQGPDFPLGGVVVDGYKLKEAYSTGRGSITQRAKYVINKDNSITFSEFPYLVDVETRIIKAIKKMVNDGYADIENVENHIGKETCNIKVILTKRANAQKVLQDLFDKTPLQKSQSINNTVVLNGVPMTMPLMGLCKNYIKFQHQILTKMATKEKAKQDKIVHINKGLVLAVAAIDDVIAIVRGSDTKDEARQKLIKLLCVDVEQADAILALQLGRLTRLDANDINVKINTAQKESDYQARIINEIDVRNSIIISNLNEMKAKFGDKRRTTVVMTEGEPVKAKDIVPENIYTILNDGTAVEIEANKFETAFKKGEQFAKYTPVMWVYNDKKPVSILQKDGTTSQIYNQIDSKSLFVWDKSKEFIVTVSAKGIIKKSLMGEYKKVDRLCKVKAEDEILYAFCVNSDENILCLLDNGKLQNVKVEDIKLSGKLTIGNKGTTAPVKCATKVAKGGLFFTVDAENHCKRSPIAELGSSTVVANEGCCIIGEAAPNMFWYDGSKVMAIDWNTVSVKGRTAQGAKIGTKKLVSIG